jgi:phosphatidyl-myo-inositol dimannoside synthase
MLLAPCLTDLGGIQAVGRDLLSAWRDDFDVIVASPPTGSMGVSGRLKLCAAAFQTRIKRRPDLVVCAHVNLAPLAQLVSGRTPYVVLAHGREVWGSMPPRRRRALRSAAAVWSVSRFTDAQVQLQGVHPQRIRRLVLGVDVDEDPPVRLETSTPHVLVIARLNRDTRYKGVDTLIRAMATPYLRVPGLRLKVAGSGNAVGDLEALAKALNVRENVDFLGRQSDDELRSLRESCWVFALPCRSDLGPPPEGEGLGLVILEAAAAGMPTIVGDSGGATDALVPDVTGLLVRPNDVDDLSRKLRTLLDDGQRRQALGIAGYEWALHNRSKVVASAAAVKVVEEIAMELGLRR